MAAAMEMDDSLLSLSFALSLSLSLSLSHTHTHTHTCGKIKKGKKRTEKKCCGECPNFFGERERGDTEGKLEGVVRDTG